MLRSLIDFLGYTAGATDGDAGKVRNLLLDDERWVVRHLVIEPGSFLDGVQVLISPASVRGTSRERRRIELALAREQVWNSPSVESDKPVSRQDEGDYSRYYGFPFYWRKAGAWDRGESPVSAAPGRIPAGAPGDAHLRSGRDLRGFHVQGTDGRAGHLHDFLLDDESWEVRHLVIDTGEWWPGRKVLVPPRWVRRISWPERRIHLEVPRGQVLGSPAWRPRTAVDREYDALVHDGYGRPGSAGGTGGPKKASASDGSGSRQ